MLQTQRLNREIFQGHVTPRGVGVEEGVEREGGAPELVILKAAGVPRKFGGERDGFGGQKLFGEVAMFGGGIRQIDDGGLGIARFAAVKDGFAHQHRFEANGGVVGHDKMSALDERVGTAIFARGDVKYILLKSTSLL